MSRLQIEDFLSMMQAERNASRHTIDAYRRDLNQMFDYFEPKAVTMESADADAIAKYIKYLSAKRRLSAKTCARKLSCIRHFFRFLLSENIRKDDPTTFIDSPKRTHPLPHTLSQEEILTLLKASSEDGTEEGLRLYALLQILYASGLRVSELVGLTLGNIQITARDGRETACLLVKGKGGKERLVPLHETAVRAMYAYLQVRKSFMKDKESHWLFPSRSASGHMTRQRFGQLLKELGVKTGIELSKLHPHALRHSFASHLLAGGADLRVVQELLGHADISTTQIYTHVLPDRLQRLVQEHHPLSKEKKREEEPA